LPNTTHRRITPTGYAPTLEQAMRYGYGPEARYFNEEFIPGPAYATQPTPVAPMPLPSEQSDGNSANNADVYKTLGGLAGGFILPEAAKWATGSGGDGFGKGGLLESLNGSTALQSALLGGAGTGIGRFLGGVAGGEDPEDILSESIFSGLGSAGGAALGSFLGPVGTMVGGAVGGFVGDKVGGFVEDVDDAIFDRVICSTLWKEGHLTRREVQIDLQFTRDRLSRTHVRGYHLWAYRAAGAIRQGRWVRFWKFIARRRSRELGYQLGYYAKPDYAGKMIRLVFEPFCYTLGKFKEITDGWRTIPDVDGRDADRRARASLRA